MKIRFENFYIKRSLNTKGKTRARTQPRAVKRELLLLLTASRQFTVNQPASAKTAHEQTALQRQIAATDREIDALVYALYGLTDEEIRIVEEATAR